MRRSRWTWRVTRRRGRDGGAHPGHAWSGPARSGFFADTSAMLTDQWGTHALSDVMLAQSLLAATEGVDGGRIGVTGISWGGGADQRGDGDRPTLQMRRAGLWLRVFCMIPNRRSRGCAWPTRRSSRSGRSGIRRAIAWMRRCRRLWVNGDRDPHFSLDIFSRSAAAVTKAPATLCIHPAMHHSHPPGYNPKEVPEIYAFADSVLKGGEPLTKIARQPEGREAVVGYEGARPVVRAEAYYLTGALEYIPGATPRAGLQLKDPWKKVEGGRACRGKDGDGEDAGRRDDVLFEFDRRPRVRWCRRGWWRSGSREIKNLIRRRITHLKR